MLYIVGTPIGNLDDISYRQVKTLFSTDIILAEDTRSAKTLLDACVSRFPSLTANRKPPDLISYYKEKEFEKLYYVIEKLKENKKVCIISESGMPLISDPGYLLVKQVIKQKIPLTVIPGPSSVTTALTMSGFEPNNFMFLGFFPKKTSEQITTINRLIGVKKLFKDVVFVFFESPNRINQTMKVIKESGWDPDIIICREMTKKFEETLRGKAMDLMNINYKGELTVLLS